MHASTFDCRTVRPTSPPATEPSRLHQIHNGRHRRHHHHLTYPHHHDHRRAASPARPPRHWPKPTPKMVLKSTRGRHRPFDRPARCRRRFWSTARRGRLLADDPTAGGSTTGSTSTSTRCSTSTRTTRGGPGRRQFAALVVAGAGRRRTARTLAVDADLPGICSVTTATAPGLAARLASAERVVVVEPQVQIGSRRPPRSSQRAVGDSARGRATRPGACTGRRPARRLAAGCAPRRRREQPGGYWRHRDDGDDRVRAVRTVDGTQRPADLVIIAVGIALSLDLAVTAASRSRRGDGGDQLAPRSTGAGGHDVARFPSRFAGSTPPARR